MADIVPITRDVPVYHTPDFDVIAQSTKNLNRLPFFKTNQMQSLQDKGKRVISYAQDLDELLRDEVPSLSVSVNNLGLDDTFSTLAEIDGALQDTSLDDGTKAALMEERGNLAASIGEGIGGVAGKFQRAAQKIESTIEEMNDIVIAERVEGVLAEQEKLKAQMSAESEEEHAAKRKLEEQREQVIESQDVIRAKKITDTFKDYIPSGDDLDGLDLANPEVEAIKQGAEVAKKILGNISDGLKYIDLAEARKSLDDKIDELSDKLEILDERLTGVEALMDDLHTAQKVDEERQRLGSETQKISAAWNAFADAVTSLNGAEVTVERVGQLVASQSAYLDALTKARSQVILT